MREQRIDDGKCGKAMRCGAFKVRFAGDFLFFKGE